MCWCDPNCRTPCCGSEECHRLMKAENPGVPCPFCERKKPKDPPKYEDLTDDEVIESFEKLVEMGHVCGAEEAKQELRRRLSELRAARIAYANEFLPNADGEPDVGSIHENIRKLKEDRRALHDMYGTGQKTIRELLAQRAEEETRSCHECSGQRTVPASGGNWRVPCPTCANTERLRFGEDILKTVENPEGPPLGAPNSLMRRAQELGLRLKRGK